MIFETLAAMADWENDKKFNLNADAAQAKTILEDARNTGTKTVIDEMTKSGVMTVTTETITVGGVTKTNDPLNYLNQHIAGIQSKAPRKTVDENSTDRV